MTSLSVVTVSYNSSFVLPTFLEGLNSAGVSDVEVVVVDSGSTDADASRAIVERQGASFIGLNENVGYGQGSNVGVSAARGDWVALVNPDVAISSTDLLALVGVAEQVGLDCIGPTLVAPPDAPPAPPSARGLIRPFWTRERPTEIKDLGPAWESPSMSGCCMVVRAASYRQIGGFDSRFFMFCEEIDLHQRLAASGYRLGVAKSIVALTAGGGSSEGISSRWADVQRSVSHVIYTRKHFGLVAAAVDAAWRVLGIVAGHAGGSRIESLRQFFGELKRSKQLQKVSVSVG